MIFLCLHPLTELEFDPKVEYDPVLSKLGTEQLAVIAKFVNRLFSEHLVNKRTLDLIACGDAERFWAVADAIADEMGWSEAEKREHTRYSKYFGSRTRRLRAPTGEARNYLMGPRNTDERFYLRAHGDRDIFNPWNLIRKRVLPETHRSGDILLVGSSEFAEDLGFRQMGIEHHSGDLYELDVKHELVPLRLVKAGQVLWPPERLMKIPPGGTA